MLAAMNKQRDGPTNNITAVDHKEVAETAKEKYGVERPAWFNRRLAVRANRKIGIIIQ